MRVRNMIRTALLEVETELLPEAVYTSGSEEVGDRTSDGSTRSPLLQKCVKACLLRRGGEEWLVILSLTL